MKMGASTLFLLSESGVERAGKYCKSLMCKLASSSPSPKWFEYNEVDTTIGSAQVNNPEQVVVANLKPGDEQYDDLSSEELLEVILNDPRLVLLLVVAIILIILIIFGLCGLAYAKSKKFRNFLKSFKKIKVDLKIKSSTTATATFNAQRNSVIVSHSSSAPQVLELNMQPKVTVMQPQRLNATASTALVPRPDYEIDIV